MKHPPFDNSDALVDGLPSANGTELPPGERTDEGRPARTPQRSALRVLLVEDLPRVQALLRELIDEPGRFDVAGMAETESDAVQQFMQLRPDAVVVDLNLRSGTGLGVITALRKDPSPTRPLLIVLTNHALPVLEAACLSAGADYFLDKSRDFHKVRTLLEHAWSADSVLPAVPSVEQPPPGVLPH